jgi:hypothetical protein
MAALWMQIGNMMDISPDSPLCKFAIICRKATLFHYIAVNYASLLLIKSCLFGIKMADRVLPLLQGSSLF